MPHEGLAQTLSAAVPLVTNQVAGFVASLPVRLNGVASDTAIGLASRSASRSRVERATMPPLAHAPNSTQTQGASPATPGAAAPAAAVESAGATAVLCTSANYHYRLPIGMAWLKKAP